MPKLRTLSGAQARAILEGRGFAMVRQKGSHMMLELRDSSGTKLVPIPNHKTLTRGTLSSIIRLSGLPRSLLKPIKKEMRALSWSLVVSFSSRRVNSHVQS